MNCTDCQDLLLDLAYGELAPDQAAAVQAHAQGCAQCGPEYAKLLGARQAVAPLLTGLRALEQPRPGFDDKLLAAAREAVRQQAAAARPPQDGATSAQVLSLDAARRKRQGWLRAAVGVSVAAAAGLALVFNSGQKGPPLQLAEEPAPSAAKAVSAAAPGPSPQPSPTPPTTSPPAPPTTSPTVSPSAAAPPAERALVAERQAGDGVKKSAAPSRRSKAKSASLEDAASALDDDSSSGGNLGVLSGAGVAGGPAGSVAGLGSASNLGGAGGATASAGAKSNVPAAAPKDQPAPSMKKGAVSGEPSAPAASQPRAQPDSKKAEAGLDLSPRRDLAEGRKSLKSPQAESSAPEKPAQASPMAPSPVVAAQAPTPPALAQVAPPPAAPSQPHGAGSVSTEKAALAKAAATREESPAGQTRASPLAMAEIHEQQAAASPDPAAAAWLWQRAARLRAQAGDTSGAARAYAHAVERFAAARLPADAQRAYQALAALSPAQVAELAEARTSLEKADAADRARKAAQEAKPAESDASKAADQGY